MKRKTAKEILAESFRELAGSKSIDKITIQEITDNCGYSPATFYRQFRDKYDLIAWDYSRETEQIMAKIDGRGYTWRQSLIDGALYFRSRKQYLANLFQNTSGHDSFVRYMADIHSDALRKHLLSSCEKTELSPKEEMLVRIYCLGTVSLTCEWILGIYDCTPEEIAEIYEDSLPLPLRALLL